MDDTNECIEVSAAELPWLIKALQKASGARPSKVLIVLDAKDYTDLIDKRPGWRDLVDASELVIGISGLARPSVLKQPLPGSVEVGVLR